MPHVNTRKTVVATLHTWLESKHEFGCPSQTFVVLFLFTSWKCSCRPSLPENKLGHCPLSINEETFHIFLCACSSRLLLLLLLRCNDKIAAADLTSSPDAGFSRWETGRLKKTPVNSMKTVFLVGVCVYIPLFHGSGFLVFFIFWPFRGSAYSIFSNIISIVSFSSHFNVSYSLLPCFIPRSRPSFPPCPPVLCLPQTFRLRLVTCFALLCPISSTPLVY